MNRISTFDELMAERKRLEADLERQKEYMRSQVADIREKFAPVTKVLAFFSRLGHNGGPGMNLLKLGSNVGIDLLVGQKLKKAGWLTKMLLPLAMKFTAHRSIDAVKNNKR